MPWFGRTVGSVAANADVGHERSREQWTHHHQLLYQVHDQPPCKPTTTPRRVSEEIAKRKGQYVWAGDGTRVGEKKEEECGVGGDGIRGKHGNA